MASYVPTPSPTYEDEDNQGLLAAALFIGASVAVLCVLICLRAAQATHAEHVEARRTAALLLRKKSCANLGELAAASAASNRRTSVNSTAIAAAAAGGSMRTAPGSVAVRGSFRKSGAAAASMRTAPGSVAVRGSFRKSGPPRKLSRSATVPARLARRGSAPPPRASDPIAFRHSDPVSGGRIRSTSDPSDDRPPAFRHSDPLGRRLPRTPSPLRISDTRLSDPTRLLQRTGTPLANLKLRLSDPHARRSDPPPARHRAASVLTMPARALARREATDANQSLLQIRFARAQLEAQEASEGHAAGPRTLERTDSEVMRALGRRKAKADELHAVMAHRQSLAEAMVAGTAGGSQRRERHRVTGNHESVLDPEGHRKHAQGRRKHRGKRRGHGHGHHHRHRRRKRQTEASVTTTLSAVSAASDMTSASEATSATRSRTSVAESATRMSLSGGGGRHSPHLTDEMEEHAHAWAEEAREAVANAPPLALGERVRAKLPEWPSFFDGTIVGGPMAGPAPGAYFRVVFGDESAELVPATLIHRHALSRGGGSPWGHAEYHGDSGDDSDDAMRVTMFVGDDELGSGGTGHLQQGHHSPHGHHHTNAADYAFLRFTHAGGGAYHDAQHV